MTLLGLRWSVLKKRKEKALQCAIQFQLKAIAPSDRHTTMEVMMTTAVLNPNSFSACPKPLSSTLPLFLPVFFFFKFFPAVRHLAFVCILADMS